VRELQGQGSSAGQMTRISLLLLLALALPAPAPAADERLSVYVSIPPQKYFLERIGGEYMDISVMLGAGDNPHNYDPSPRKVAGLAGARAYFTIGVPFEQIWQPRMQAVNHELEFIHCGADLSGNGAGHGHTHTQDHRDPHIWTSPPEAQAISACMLEALLRLDPLRSKIYNINHAQLQQELGQLHDEIRTLLEPLATRYFLVQHPAWDHFAETYGLEQVAIEQHGHEPNARYLARVIEFARHHGLTRIFVQPQFSIAAAELVAEAIGGHIVEADPLAEDYIGTMRRLAQEIAAAGAKP
jgi:zinc transport system substrate-binding protein